MVVVNITWNETEIRNNHLLLLYTVDLWTQKLMTNAKNILHLVFNATNIEVFRIGNIWSSYKVALKTNRILSVHSFCSIKFHVIKVSKQ